MATAILDIDVERIPTEVAGLSAYGQALVLLRLRGRPVGQVRVPVVHGCVRGSELREAIIEKVGWHIWKRWLHDWLDWDEEALATTAVPRATVAVCTRDRPDDLRRCLTALSGMPDDAQELLVVDNCPSSDASHRVTQTFPGVRYVREDVPGLDCARNRAIREASQEVVAFIDNDAMPDPGWLCALLRNFDDPLVACVTGLTMPFELETAAQQMHERLSPFGRGYERKVFDAISLNPTAFGKVGAGVNMALRRSSVLELGPFDEALDAGTATYSGGDTEMFARIMNRGYRIAYEPGALCWHRHRRTWKELRRMIYGYGAGVYAAWTSLFVSERQITMLKPAIIWFFRYQLPALFRSMRSWHRNAPLDLAIAELCGCMAGPWLYFSSRRRRAKGARS